MSKEHVDKSELDPDVVGAENQFLWHAHLRSGDEPDPQLVIHESTPSGRGRGPILGEVAASEFLLRTLLSGNCFTEQLRTDSYPKSDHPTCNAAELHAASRAVPPLDGAAELLPKHQIGGVFERRYFAGSYFIEVDSWSGTRYFYLDDLDRFRREFGDRFEQQMPAFYEGPPEPMPARNDPNYPHELLRRAFEGTPPMVGTKWVPLSESS